MGELIETLDGKTKILINAFSHGFRINILDEKKKFNLSWHLYLLHLIGAWDNYLEDNKEITLKLRSTNYKFSIEGLIQMTEQFLGPSTVYAKNASVIINNKTILYNILRKNKDKFEKKIKNSYTKLLNNAKTVLYGVYK